MYSSHSLSKHCHNYVHFLVLVATKLLLICNVTSLNLTNTYLHHKCFPNQGDYTPGSRFDKKLIDLMGSFDRLDLKSGFEHISTEKSYSNTVSIKLQCRGDSYGPLCRSCFKVAISDMLKRCPRNKNRIIWYDQCFIDTTVSLYNNNDRLRINYENNFFVHNANKVSGDAKLFNKETISFLQNLTVKANDEENKGENGEIALYAAGEKMIGAKKLYAMVQCIRSVFVMHEMKMCKKCLDTIITKDFSKCCDGKQGGRVLGTSCYFRYELYPFLRT